MAANCPLTIIRGDSFSASIEWIIDDEIQDISDATVVAQIRSGRTRNSTLIGSFLVDLTTDKTILLSLTPAETGKLLDRSYYDIQITRGTTVYTLCGGLITMDGDITHV